MSESFNCFPIVGLPENEFGLCETPSRCTRICLSGNSFVCSKHKNQCIDFLKSSSSSLITPSRISYSRYYFLTLIIASSTLIDEYLRAPLNRIFVSTVPRENVRILLLLLCSLQVLPSVYQT